MNQRWIHQPTMQEVRELGGFEVILTDNPWKHRDTGIRGGTKRHYNTMSLAELCMMPVESLAADNAVIFMWACWPTLLDAFAVMKAWGFEYKNCGLLWAKTNTVTPSPFVGLGHWTRGNTEPCLMGVRGKPKRIDKAVQQLMVDDLIVAPIAEHSEKPAETRTRITQLMGDVPSIELFAREQVPGWECFGNQVQPSGPTVTLEYA